MASRAAAFTADAARNGLGLRILDGTGPSFSLRESASAELPANWGYCGEGDWGGGCAGGCAGVGFCG
jgi:hypothetical protein